MKKEIAGMQVTINLNWQEDIVKEHLQETYNGHMIWAIELMKCSSNFKNVLKELGVESENDVNVALIGYNNVDGLNFKFSVSKKV